MERTFWKVLNRDKVTGKDTKKNEKVCDTSEEKKDLFCEDEVVTVLKALKNNKTPSFDSAVNEFFNMVVLKLEIYYWRLWIWFF